MSLRLAMALGLALTACGPAHKSGPKPTHGSLASPWVGPHLLGLGAGVTVYEVYVHRSYANRQRQCFLVGFEAHWSKWSQSRRSQVRVGRHRFGRVFFEPMSTPPTRGYAWALIGDNEAIHVIPADHKLPGLSAAIDTHQDPFLEGMQARTLPQTLVGPGVYSAPVVAPRWIEVDAIDRDAQIEAFTLTQNIGDH